MSQSEVDETMYRGSKGGKLKTTTGWPTDNSSNESGFSALPGGLRMDSDGSFALGSSASFWTSTTSDNENSWMRDLSSGDYGIGRYYSYQMNGHSARYIKN